MSQMTNLKSSSSFSSHQEWQASLDLAFTVKNKKTILSKNLHFGPLMVQKPFYPELVKVCHVYLLHPPGGVVHGDQLKININIDSSAHALITTPAVISA